LFNSDEEAARRKASLIAESDKAKSEHNSNLMETLKKGPIKVYLKSTYSLFFLTHNLFCLKQTLLVGKNLSDIKSKG